MLNRFAKTFALISECTRLGNQSSYIIVVQQPCNCQTSGKLNIQFNGEKWHGCIQNWKSEFQWIFITALKYNSVVWVPSSCLVFNSARRQSSSANIGISVISSPWQSRIWEGCSNNEQLTLCCLHCSVAMVLKKCSSSWQIWVNFLSGAQPPLPPSLPVNTKTLLSR